MYFLLKLVSIMSVTDYEPLFYINIKKSGKECHKFLIGEHSIPRHVTICKGTITVPTSTPTDSVEGGRTVPTSTPINSVTEVDEVGRNVFFSFDKGLAVNTETEINLSQLEDEVFSFERSIMDFQQAGPSCQQVEELYGPPRQHNFYVSGDMSSQLIDQCQDHKIYYVIMFLCLITND